MKRFEKIVDSLLIGSTFPLLLGLVSVFVWFFLDGLEKRAILYLSVGLSAGILIDVKFLKRWIRQRFDLPVWFMAAIYVLYNIFVFGFFMGFPVFNVFLGLVAGFYYANRICSKGIQPEMKSKYVKRISSFTGVVMALICSVSGYLALVHNEAAGMIKEVLSLDFEVTVAMVWGIVLTGGLILILTNILFVRISMIRTIRNYDC